MTTHASPDELPLAATTVVLDIPRLDLNASADSTPTEPAAAVEDTALAEPAPEPDATAEAGDLAATPTRLDTASAGGAPPPARRREAPLPPAKASSQRFQEVLSGQFDADDEEAASALRKRVLPPRTEMPKLHKVLAQSGMGSRLEMEQLIDEGRISVNGEPAHTGQRIQFGDQIKVNGKSVRVRIDPPPARVIAYHKPVGELVSHDDPQNRPTVFRKLPKLSPGKWQSVGRLDLNTEGLLLLTNSGELANQLMHPRFGLEREYAVRVLGALSAEEKSRLLSGVQLDDGPAQFSSIEEGGGEGANCWYRVTIAEGRNREVRRMLEAVGHAVSRLIRIRYGAMVLPRGLKRGAWLELDDNDIRALMQASRASGERAPASGPAAPSATAEPARHARGRNRRGPGSRVGNPAPGPALAPRRNTAPNAMPPSAQSDSDADEHEDRIIGPQPDPLRTSIQSLRRRNPGRRYDGNPAPPRGAGRSGGGAGGGAGGGGGSGGQPDPMKTAFGYIGADSFIRQRAGPPSRPFSNGNTAGPRRNNRGKR